MSSKKINYILSVIVILAIAFILFDNYYLDRHGRVRVNSAETGQASLVDTEEKSHNTIAVLPFQDISQEKDQGYFVDGLSEEILNNLAKMPDLRVIGRAASFSFKDQNKSMQEIADILGVDYILEGNVRKAGNALRITAQLIRTSDGQHLWSETYDRELKDIFTIQADIANNIADKFKLTLEAYQLLGGTQNIEAYELYLNARSKIYDDNNGALELLDKAISLDPKFALAWAWKAQVYGIRSTYIPISQASSDFDAGLNASLKAIELEPNLGQAYFPLGSFHSRRGEFIKAESAFRKGMELTHESKYGLTLHYVTVGYLKKVLELYEEMLRNNPSVSELRSYYILSLGLNGDMNRVEEEYERGKLEFGDDFASISLNLAFLGNKDNIPINDIREFPSTDPIWAIGRKYKESPEDGLAELRRIYSSEGNQDGMYLFCIAVMATHLGDLEFALEAMEKGGSIYRFWFPVFHEMRQLPRFKEFAREKGLVDLWKQYGWPDLCHPVGDDDFECD